MDIVIRDPDTGDHACAFFSKLERNWGIENHCASRMFMLGACTCAYLDHLFFAEIVCTCAVSAHIEIVGDLVAFRFGHLELCHVVQTVVAKQDLETRFRYGNWNIHGASTLCWVYWKCADGCLPFNDIYIYIYIYIYYTYTCMWTADWNLVSALVAFVCRMYEFVIYTPEKHAYNDHVSMCAYRKFIIHRKKIQIDTCPPSRMAHATLRNASKNFSGLMADSTKIKVHRSIVPQPTYTHALVYMHVFLSPGSSYTTIKTWCITMYSIQSQSIPPSTYYRKQHKAFPLHFDNTKCVCISVHSLQA